MDPTIQYGVIDFSDLSTEPGGPGPMAPPVDWSGTSADYKAFLRRRYRDPGGAQHLFCAARSVFRADSNAVQAKLYGPFYETAKEVLSAIYYRG